MGEICTVFGRIWVHILSSSCCPNGLISQESHCFFRHSVSFVPPKQLYRNRPRNSTIYSQSISPHAIFIAMDTFNRCKQSYRSVSRLTTCSLVALIIKNSVKSLGKPADFHRSCV